MCENHSVSINIRFLVNQTFSTVNYKAVHCDIFTVYYIAFYQSVFQIELTTFFDKKMTVVLKT